MNEATKYNRAKTWQIALFALNMMSTNMYLFFNDVCILLCKWNFRNVCSICIYTGNFYANF